MKKDVSNETVVVLAILTIIISLVGVATVFYETAQTKSVSPQQEASASGTVSLRIAEEPPVHSSESTISIKIRDETPLN